MKIEEHLQLLEKIYSLPESHRSLPMEERLVTMLVKQQTILDRLGERIEKLEKK